MKREDKQAMLDEMILLNEVQLPKISVNDPLGMIETLLENYEQLVLNHVDEEGLNQLLTPILVVKHVIKHFASESTE